MCVQKIVFFKTNKRVHTTFWCQKWDLVPWPPFLTRSSCSTRSVEAIHVGFTALATCCSPPPALHEDTGAVQPPAATDLHTTRIECLCWGFSAQHHASSSTHCCCCRCLKLHCTRGFLPGCRASPTPLPPGSPLSGSRPDTEPTRCCPSPLCLVHDQALPWRHQSNREGSRGKSQPNPVNNRVYLAPAARAAKRWLACQMTFTAFIAFLWVVLCISNNFKLSNYNFLFLLILLTIYHCKDGPGY